jgi:hypothetical protein
MAKFESGSCPVTGGCDKLSCLLSKVGINRSMLVTLALLPFAWDGAVLVKNAVVAVAHVVMGLFGNTPAC